MKFSWNLTGSLPESDARVTDKLHYSDYVHRRPNTDLEAFPGNYGWPLVGRTFSLIKDLRGLAMEHYSNYGPVSRIQLSTRKGLLVLGADVSKRLFLDSGQEFSARMGYADSLRYFFPGGLLLKDYDDHRFQRRIMQTSFKSETLRSYTGSVNEVISTGLDGWNFDSSFKFFPNIKMLLLEAGLKIFYGVDRSDSTPLQNIYQAFLDAVNGQMGIIHLNIPGLTYHKGIKGRDKLRQFVADLLPLKRSNEDGSMLSYMCRETDEQGRLFSDADIIGHVNFILFAAHDTTTSTLTHLAYYLARHPDLQDRLRKEVLAANSPMLDDSTRPTPEFDNAFDETLRLHPSVPIMARRTLKECELLGHTIPPHTQLFHIPGFNHLMPEYWDNAYNFDPDRFLPGKGRHKQHSFSFIPFGGGAHKCIGMHYARLQARLFIHQFLHRYRFELPADYREVFTSVPLPKIKDNLPLIVKRL